MEATNYEITELVIGALFFVYESAVNPNLDDIVENALKITDQSYVNCLKVMSKLVSKLYLIQGENLSAHTSPEVTFGTNGLWLLENSFMHGEESVDSMALAERILTQNNFFRE